MEIALSIKNKFVIVNGDFSSPDEKFVLFSHWKRVNYMIITWILSIVTDETSSSIHHMDSVFVVWHELDGRFVVINGHKIYKL